MSRKDVTDRMVVMAYLICNQLELSRYPYEVLEGMTGECEKVCYRAMERACDNGYIEYGVSLRCGWITAEGYTLITATIPEQVKVSLQEKTL